MAKRRLCVLVCALLLALAGIAQPADIPSVPGGDINKASQKLASLETKLTVTTQKYLNRFKKMEEKMFRKLRVKDSATAFRLFSEAPKKYNELLQKLQRAPGEKIRRIKEYIPGLDSLQTVFGFIENKIPGLDPAVMQKIQLVSGKLEGIQRQMASCGDIAQFIKERKRLLTEGLENVGMGKELAKLSKEAYYYQYQLAEYKEMLKDPGKIAAKLMSVMRDHAGFKEFFKQHSQLAQLFGMPGGSSTAQNVQGLQTRQAVQQQFSQQVGVGGNMVDPQQYLQQQIQQATSQLNTLKDKLNQLGGGNGELEMPAFKPNTQRTKSFWDRIEYGLNIQSQRPNGLLPVSSDFAFTVGYKLNDKSIIGIGAGYKMGWGKSISEIRISNQGMSLRSFADWKLKGSFWISGGFEYNYLQEFKKLDILKDLDAWQKSALIGLTKKYKIGKKQGNLQLLWDFLSYNQAPGTSPLKFRIGYTF